jgi:hypothetical protein
MTFESIRLAHRDGVSTITLDRPIIAGIPPGGLDIAPQTPHPLGRASARPWRAW